MTPGKTNYVLEALQKERIGTLTKEALVRAFNDDGILNLEDAVEHMLKRIRNDIELRKTEPRLVDFAHLGRRTPPDTARGIVHPAPEVPFVLDGVTYEPQDIRRLNGQALLFIPVVAADGSSSLQLFHEEIGTVLAGYLQVRQVASLVYPTDFPIPGVSGPTKPGEPPPPTYPPLNPPGGSGAPPPPPPAGGGGGGGGSVFPPAPFTYGQIQMFDGGGYQGNWFWLAKGFMWTDLTRVSRGGFFGGDWNDEIFSLGSTNTSCIYCEHINLEGSKLFLGPNRPIDNLVPLGWHNRISSVWNFDT